MPHETGARGTLRILLAGVLLTLAGTAPAQAQQTDAAAGRSVLDGVYTEAQAERGGTVFGERCSACHSTYEFSTSGFFLSWIGATLDQLYDVIATTMPYDNPGSLEPETYAAVVAYFLKLNGYPAGDGDLDPVEGALRGIRIEPAPDGSAGSAQAGARSADSARRAGRLERDEYRCPRARRRWLSGCAARVHTEQGVGRS